jgi:hypothetical protein
MPNDSSFALHALSQLPLSGRVVVALVFITTFGVVRATNAQTLSSSDRVAVGSASIAYIAAALFGAHIAVRDSLAEAPLGWQSRRPVKQEFVVGTGTALSPGLLMLAAQAAATGFLAGPTRTARTAAGVLAIGGGLYELGQLSEPITYRILRHPRASPWDWRVSLAANLTLPSVLAVTAIRARRD